MRYKELMLVHLDRTALLNSSSCTCTLGVLLLRLASRMAVATAVKTIAPAPMTMGLLKRAMTAVLEGLLLLLVCLLGLGRHVDALPRSALCCNWLPDNFTWNMLQQVWQVSPGQQVGLRATPNKVTWGSVSVLSHCRGPSVSA